MMRYASRDGLMPGDALVANHPVIVEGDSGQGLWITIHPDTLCLITASRVIDHHCYVGEVVIELTLLVGGSLYEYVVDDHSYFLYQFKKVVHPSRT